MASVAGTMQRATRTVTSAITTMVEYTDDRLESFRLSDED
jgi:hypothetical protein